jgi:hypothetical protein
MPISGAASGDAQQVAAGSFPDPAIRLQSSNSACLVSSGALEIGKLR